MSLATASVSSWAQLPPSQSRLTLLVRGCIGTVNLRPPTHGPLWRTISSTLWTCTLAAHVAHTPSGVIRWPCHTTEGCTCAETSWPPCQCGSRPYRSSGDGTFIDVRTTGCFGCEDGLLTASAVFSETQWDSQTGMAIFPGTPSPTPCNIVCSYTCAAARSRMGAQWPRGASSNTLTNCGSCACGRCSFWTKTICVSSPLVRTVAALRVTGPSLASFFLF